MTTPVIRSLFVYPIKSFPGLRMESVRLLAEGPEWDRQWALVNEAGQVITQRERPELARIALRLVDESFIQLSADRMGEVDFGLKEFGAPTQATVWGQTLPAFEVDGEVSAWLSEVLRAPVRLVRLSDEARREFGPEAFPGRTTRFTDFAPLLVISESSRLDLEKRSGQALSMSRFRPNLVIEGVPAYAEDGWKEFRAGALTFRPLKPCTRCKITTLHPLTGVGGAEPLKTLSAYRRGDKGVEFGYYYAHLNEGVLRSNTPIEI